MAGFLFAHLWMNTLVFGMRDEVGGRACVLRARRWCSAARAPWWAMDVLVAEAVLEFADDLREAARSVTQQAQS